LVSDRKPTTAIGGSAHDKTLCLQEHLADVQRRRIVINAQDYSLV
jgi:hypothetical protein